jgi:hypothetical protein
VDVRERRALWLPLVGGREGCELVWEVGGGVVRARGREKILETLRHKHTQNKMTQTDTQ